MGTQREPAGDASNARRERKRTAGFGQPMDVIRDEIALGDPELADLSYPSSRGGSSA
jgi:hypothetical protein